MTLTNMRDLGVERLLVSCLNQACRHDALLDVSGYPAETEIPFISTAHEMLQVRGKNVDVRPNWKEQPTGATTLRYD